MPSKIHYSGKRKTIRKTPTQSKVHYSGPKHHTPKHHTPKHTTISKVHYSGGSKKYPKVDRPVYVTEKATGKMTKLQHNPSLQQRQQMHAAGYKVSTKMPSVLRQKQEWSDVHGITTYQSIGGGKYGPLTTPRDLSLQKQTSRRKEQQALSDLYGITTYNPDGSVSTIPSGPRLEKASEKPWWSW